MIIEVEGRGRIEVDADRLSQDEVDSIVAEIFPRDGADVLRDVAEDPAFAQSISLDDFKLMQKYKKENPEPVAELILGAAGELLNTQINAAKQIASRATSGDSIPKSVGEVLETFTPWGFIKAGYQHVTGTGEENKSGAATLLNAYQTGTYDLWNITRTIGRSLYDKMFGGNAPATYEDYLKEIGREGQDSEAHRLQYDEMVQRDLEEWQGKMFREQTSEELIKSLGDEKIVRAGRDVLDPSTIAAFVVPGVAGGKIPQWLSRQSSKALTKPGAAIGNLGNLMNRGLRATSERLTKATATLGEAAPIGGNLLIPGAARAGIAAAQTVPTAMELAGRGLEYTGRAMADAPTRIGGFRRLAMEQPETLAGKSARLIHPFMDPLLKQLGQGITDFGTGATVGATLGGLAEGREGFYGGLGSGGVLGLTGGTFGRFARGISGESKRRAIASDYERWASRQSAEVREWAGANARSHEDQAILMDTIDVLARGVSGKDMDVRIVSDESMGQKYGRTNDRAVRGAFMIEGERPVLELNAKTATLETALHETLHGLAKLDGFSEHVAGLRSTIAAEYTPEMIQQFTDGYKAKFADQRQVADLDTNAILEEVAADYFAAYIRGGNPDAILKGVGPIGRVIDKFSRRAAARKLEFFESGLKQASVGELKNSKAMNRAIDDLVTARRKAYRAVELDADAPQRVYTAKDLADDTTWERLRDLGYAKEVNGKRVMASQGEMTRADRERTRAILAELETLGDVTGLQRVEDGYAGVWFSPQQFDAIMRMATLSNKVKEGLRVLNDIYGRGRAANVTYGGATKKLRRLGPSGYERTRYSSRIPESNRDIVPYSIYISNAGNFVMKAIDLSLLDAKASRLFYGSKDFQDTFNNIAEFRADLRAYIDNLQRGETPSKELFGERKRDLLNKTLGVRGQVGNPLVPEGAKLKSADVPWRDFRLDRIIDITERADEIRFSEEAYQMRARANFQPDYSKQVTERMAADEVADLEFSVSTQIPTGKTPVFDVNNQQVMPSIDSILMDDVKSAKMASQINDMPGFPKVKGEKTEATINRFRDFLVDNLLWLWDSVPQEVTLRSRQWYDGGRNIAKNFAARYDTTRAGSAGVLAVLSPQLDWYQNVSLAERVMSIHRGASELTVSPEMIKRIKGFNEAKYREQVRKFVKRTSGKKYADMDIVDKAFFIRLYDETHHSRGHRIVTPEGEFGDWVMTQKGQKAKVAWRSQLPIEKAISIIIDPSVENISARLGEYNKVRNFYLNLLVPNARNSAVTIDTHAVAAAQLRPLANGDLAVLQNFGLASPSNKNIGFKGMYGIYADAYKKAAEMRGVLPREMQSVTWEAVRGLFTAEWKNKKNKLAVDQIWGEHKKGKATLDETRNKIREIAGDIVQPDWYRRGFHPASDAGIGTAANAGELSNSGIRGQRAGRPGGGGDRAVAGAVPQSSPQEVHLTFQPAATVEPLPSGSVRTNDSGYRIISKTRGKHRLYRPDGTLAGVYESQAAAAKAAERQASKDAARPAAFSPAAPDTPAFRKWFGDSKVVDAEGKPLVVYHGSKKDFSTFDTEKLQGSRTGNVTSVWGAFFTPSPGEASRYAKEVFAGDGNHGGTPNIMPVYLSIQNPYTMSRTEWDKHAMRVFRGEPESSAIKAERAFKKQLIEDGYDGIVVAGRGFNAEYIVFDPAQIKSATGNRGTFDPASPDIRYSPGDNIGDGRKVKAAALQFPDGQVFEGQSHPDAYAKAEIFYKRKGQEVPDMFMLDGWTTTDGDFIDRYAAYDLAKRAGEIDQDYDRATEGSGRLESDAYDNTRLWSPASFRADPVGGEGIRLHPTGYRIISTLRTHRVYAPDGTLVGVAEEIERASNIAKRHYSRRRR